MNLKKNFLKYLYGYIYLCISNDHDTQFYMSCYHAVTLSLFARITHTDLPQQYCFNTITRVITLQMYYNYTLSEHVHVQ